MGGVRPCFIGLTILFLLASCSMADRSMVVSQPVEFFYLEERPRESQIYAGSHSCRSCHDAEYRFWQGTDHARSLETLIKANRERQSSCLRCHTVGYGLFSGYQPDRQGDLGSVGCEACHGPSKEHARQPTERRPSGKLKAGCPPCTINEVCRRCHTWQWDPDFTPKEDFDKVICP